MAAGGATFEDFDTVVGVGVVAGGDVNGEIIAHFVKTVVDGGGGKDAGRGIFDAERFEGGGEVLQDPLGRLAGVAGEKDFDAITGVVDEAFGDVR